MKRELQSIMEQAERGYHPVYAGEDEIEAEEFDFMLRKREDATPEARADEIVSDLEDAEAIYMCVTERIRALAERLYDLYCDRLLKPEATEIDKNIFDIVTEMGRYEKMLSRILEYIRKSRR